MTGGELQQAEPKSRRPRPRLRTILLLTYILVLAVPLGGVSLLRLYDSMLIRQTEGELIVQGAAIAAVYRSYIVAFRAESKSELGATEEVTGSEAGSGDRQGARRREGGDQDQENEGEESEPGQLEEEHRFKPAIASLDLARHPVLEPVPPARPASDPVDLAAIEAGRRIEPLLIELQRTSLAGFRLVDPSGTVVATSGSELGLNLAHRSEVAAAVAGLRASVLRRRERRGKTPPLGSISRGTGLRVVVAFPVTAKGSDEEILGAVVLGRTPMSVRQAIYRDRRYFLTGGAVTVAAVTLLAWLTGAALGRPMRDLIDQTERVRRGEKNAAVPLAKPVTREVEQISRAVADMATALVERADYIAAFAANVSHEFKTPLTSIHGTVEILADHLDEMTPEEQRKFLDMLEKDAARLERLVERLLELARADVIRPGDAHVELGPVLEAVASRHRSLGLGIHVDADPLEGARLAISQEALDSILSNLVENARQHGGEGVTVALRAEKGAGKRIYLQVEDDGPGISPANRSRVFDRFFTTRRGEGGSGLGLAIVRALARAHGGEIEFESRPGNTIFTVELELAKTRGAAGIGRGEERL